MHDSKDVGFPWKSAKSQFHATDKLKNVDFSSRKENNVVFMLTRDSKDVDFT